MFNAVLIEKNADGQQVGVRQLDRDQLPAEDVTVDVSYSTVNYKDGLAMTGRSPVVRSFPMVPGIDLVGRVAESRDTRYAVGDRVLLNGWGVGEGSWGGLAQIARVKGDWLIPLPDGITEDGRRR